MLYEQPCHILEVCRSTDENKINQVDTFCVHFMTSIFMFKIETK
jgi:hypothetical protein